jgi:hypothetical protein
VKAATKPFAICIDDTDYKAPLILGKVYPMLPDPCRREPRLSRVREGTQAAPHSTLEVVPAQVKTAS